MPFVLALDQGTSSSRALIFDETLQIVASAAYEFTQHYPQPGWVEHNPNEIWQTQLKAVTSALAQVRLGANDIKAIGLTNQRETTILWDRRTGDPVAPAIVWQDRRTASWCKDKAASHAELITAKTGLIVDAYFSASKIVWLLDHVPGARKLAQEGHLAFGTVDCWLLWKLTDGHLHVTDPSNASRSMLYNIHTKSWDDELLALFDIPASLLPRVLPSSGILAHTSFLGGSTPIAGMAGDQQAALFGQLCFQPGTCKTTYGTGCFMLMHTGSTCPSSTHQLLSTVAWQYKNNFSYALEGSVFIGGAAVGWLRDGLGIISSAAEVEPLALSVNSSDGVIFVPALNGLGTPHWDQDARGTILGLTRGSTRAHLAYATLEAIALQVADLVDAMQADSGLKLTSLRVDGGAAANNLLMQMQADFLQIPVVRPQNTESTATGAAMLAGLAVGLYPDLAYLQSYDRLDRSFEPQKNASDVDEQRAQWNRAVERSKGWARS